MSTLPDNFCSAPWTSLYYQSNFARICCVSKTQVESSPINFLNSDFVKSVKSDILNNIQTPSCDGCWKLDEKNLQSVRTSTMVNYPIPNNEIPSADSQYTTQYLELRDSNLCNMACIMCGPNSSSMIQDEIQKYPTLASIFENTSISKTAHISDENWNEIYQLLPGLNTLFLTGGEPMLVKRFLTLLGDLIDMKLNSNQLKLVINTNCSVMNPKILDLFAQFNNRKLILSIDGVGKTAEYQRYGTHWPTVDNNVHQIMGLPTSNLSSIVISSTITAVNVLDISSLAKYLKHIYELGNNSVDYYMHALSYPQHFEFTLLTGELKLQAINEIEKSLETLAGITKFRDIISILNNLKTTLLNKADGVDNTELYNRFTHAIQVLDQSRDQSFMDSFGYQLY
jgi:hypothetical protein